MRKKILKNVTEVQFDNCLFLSKLPLKKQPTQRNMSYKAVTDWLYKILITSVHFLFIGFYSGSVGHLNHNTLIMSVFQGL